MNVRNLAVLAIALGCGLTAALLTSYLLPARPAAGVTVLVAQKPIPRGTSLRDGEALFALQELPQDTPLPRNCVTSFDQLREQARDHLVQTPLRPGEPLTLDHLVDRSKGGLAFALRPGYTGFAVRATAESSFSGLIQPDDYVKVLSVRRTNPAEKKTTILMKNIRVIAVERVQDRNDRAGSVPATLTLEVTDDEAKKLRLAEEDGPLALALIALADAKDLTDRKGEEDANARPAPSGPVTQEPMPLGVADKREAEPASGRTFTSIGPSGQEVWHWSDQLGRYTHAEQLGRPGGNR